MKAFCLCFVVCVCIPLCTKELHAQEPYHAENNAAPALPDSPSALKQHKESNALDAANLHTLGGAPPALAIMPQPPAKHANVVDRKFILFTVFQFAASIADVESTQYGLSHGAAEGNPLFGSRPSRAKLYSIALPVSAGVSFWSYRLKKAAPHSGYWMIPSLVTGTTHTGAAIYNLFQSH